MTTKEFKNTLIKSLSEEFVDDTNTDLGFEFLADNQVVLSGSDHTEVFIVTIDKVYDEDTTPHPKLP